MSDWVIDLDYGHGYEGELAAHRVSNGSEQTITLDAIKDADAPTYFERTDVELIEIAGTFDDNVYNIDSSGFDFSSGVLTPTAGGPVLILGRWNYVNAYLVNSYPAGFTIIDEVVGPGGSSQRCIIGTKAVNPASGSYGPFSVNSFGPDQSGTWLYSFLGGSVVQHKAVAIEGGIDTHSITITLDNPPTPGNALVLFGHTKGSVDGRRLSQPANTGTACNANFHAVPVIAAPGQIVTFTDDSVGATSWLWDFGDGTTSTLENPTHAYAEVGLYTVSLSIAGVACSDEEVKTDYIRVVTSFSLDVNRIIPPGFSYEGVGTLNEANKKSIRAVLNEPGTGQFAINKNSVEATSDAIAVGNFVKVRFPEIDDNYIFAFFMDQGDFTLLSSDEEGGEDLVFGGAGLLSYLDRAVWRNYKYSVQWWPEDVSDPPDGAEGLLRVKAGKYRFYLVAGTEDVPLNIIYGGPGLSYIIVEVVDFDAYFHDFRMYRWPQTADGSITSHIDLAHIMAGQPHEHDFMAPFDNASPIEAIFPSWTAASGEPIILTNVASTPGGVLYRMIQEAQHPDRPAQPIPLVTIDFTETTDSNGDAWTTTDALTGLSADPGEDYITTLGKLVATGVLDVWMDPDFSLHAVNSPSGRDLTGLSFGPDVVRFQKAVNIAEQLQREMLDRKVATHAEVQSNVNGGYQRAVTELADADDRVTREIGVFADTTEIEHEMVAVGDAALAATLATSDSLIFEHVTGDDDDHGIYLPGQEGTEHGKYWLGDTVSFHTGTGELDYDNAEPRVIAITIKEDDDTGQIRATPELIAQVGEAEREAFGSGFGPRSGGVGYSARPVGGTAPPPDTVDLIADLALDDLSDVNAPSPSDGDALVWDDGTGEWVPGTVSGSGSSIFVNVMDAPYNAAGDDTTDDTAAIQAAIDDWKNTGATIFFPRGTYKITAQLDVDSTSATGNLLFLGEGGGDSLPASKIRMATANTTAFKGNHDAYVMAFENLDIEGPTGGSSGAGIWGNDRNVETFNCRIAGFFYGIRIGAQSYYSRIMGTLIYNNASHGIWQEAGSNNLMVNNCHVTSNGGCGIKIDGSQGTKIIGGSVEENTSHGISVDTVGGQTTDATYIGAVYFEHNGSACIKVGDTASVRSTTIIGCMFTSPQSGYFIDVEAADYVTIGSCHFLGSPGSGDIRLQSGITHAVQWNNRPSGVGNTYTSTPVILENAITDPTTTRGDLIARNSGGALARLALGAANTVLHGSSTDPSYSAVVEGDLGLTDITTANVSTTKHGFAPKLPNDATKFLDGTGAYTTPSGSGGTSQHILLADGHSTPFTFNDLLQMDDGSDFMWSDPE